jgi:hypothetical protein
MTEKRLTKNKVYSVELYPTKEIVRASYIGMVGKDPKWGGESHVFINEDKDYLLVGDHEMLVNGETVTYRNIFSSVIIRVPKDSKNHLVELRSKLESLIKEIK